MTSPPWWQTAVIYQIYPRAFADSDGDGVGDLPGIRSRLEHLRWLGVDGLWLSPVYRSPMADFGYDVSDHCDVDPVFGDLADMDGLIADAHAGGLRVLLDWVPNHTSDRHPWFLDARSSRDAEHRDWYWWRGDDPERRPNNWRAAFGGPAWTWDEVTGAWYLHLFLPEQPDLNWGNPAVVEAMHGVLRFWLDRGIDGFRADVVHLIGKDEALPDQPAELAHLDLVGVHDHPRTHELLRGIRRVLDAYPGERTMVGEVNLGSAALLAPYYGRGDELPLVFNFTLLRAPWDAARWAELVHESEAALGAGEAWPVWVLSNHDEVRHRSRYGGSEARARVAATVLLTLRGTPFLYAGEELGLENVDVAPEDRVDPGGRDGCRAPIPWPEAERQRGDEGSVLHLYRRLLAERRASPALHRGAWRLLDAPPGVLAYEREHEGERRRVYANFGDEAVELDLGGWRVVVASDGRSGGNGRVPATTAVVLAPA